MKIHWIAIISQTQNTHYDMVHRVFCTRLLVEISSKFISLASIGN